MEVWIYDCTTASNHHHITQEAYPACHNGVTKLPFESSDLESSEQQLRAFRPERFSHHLYWILLTGSKKMQQQNHRASRCDCANHHEKLSETRPAYELNAAYVVRAC
jgi:hypothetical protein